MERKLALLRAHKACGPNNVPNWFCRDFSVWLCAIFNASICQGIVPLAWKLEHGAVLFIAGQVVRAVLALSDVDAVLLCGHRDVPLLNWRQGSRRRAPC